MFELDLGSPHTPPRICTYRTLPGVSWLAEAREGEQQPIVTGLNVHAPSSVQCSDEHQEQRLAPPRPATLETKNEKAELDDRLACSTLAVLYFVL